MAEKQVYHGDHISYCPKAAYNLRNSAVVVVSGDGPNVCGHAILNTGGCAGWYFHVGGLNDPIYFMGAAGYTRYLRETGKKEIRRQMLNLPKPDAAMARLMELMSKKWRWMVLPHNCVSFVEEIAKAGGLKAGLYLNCPIYESFR